MGGGDEGRATMGEASKDMPQGRHLTVVYPALFSLVLCGFHRQFAFYSKYSDVLKNFDCKPLC